jgi:PAS domain S-box-containing protein
MSPAAGERIQRDAELEELRFRLAEAEDTIAAIRGGQIDALVVNTPEGARIFTVAGAERPSRIFIEQMGEGAASLAADGRILFFNRQFADLLRLPDGDAAGRSIYEFLSPEGRGRFDLLTKVSPAVPERAEVLLTRDDGSEVPVYLSASVFEQDGVQTVCVVAADLTELKREEALKARAENALRQAQKMEAVGQLTGGIAHDFNNLLTAALGSLDLLEQRIADPAALKLVRSARRAGERGAKLVEQLLAFSRRQHLVPKPLDLAKVLSGAEELLPRTIGPAVEIRFDFTAGLWPVVADATQLQMMLLNLALNARDAMPDGGMLTIAAVNAPAAGALPEDLAPGDYVRLSVTDSGTGMTPDVLARAVEPFFTTKEVGHGSGLGLSQVFGVAKQFGGTMTIDSRVGRGTTVAVYLPRSREPTQEALSDAGTTPWQARGDGSLILVVDDDAEVRALVRMSLEEMGYRVVEVDRAEDALEQLRRRNDIRALVSDIAMAQMNGFQLAERALQQRAGLPILLITGFADTSGFPSSSLPVRILKKPFRLAELGEAVGDLLRQKG